MRVSLEAFGTQVHAWQQIVIFAALLSIVIGALGAIGQNNIKRLMAYSSINNVGFMLIGLACANQPGAAAMLVYLAIYVAMSVAGFVAVLMLKDANGEPVEAITDPLAEGPSLRTLLTHSPHELGQVEDLRLRHCFVKDLPPLRWKRVGHVGPQLAEPQGAHLSN